VFWHLGVGDGRIRVMSELGDEEIGSDRSLSYFEKIRAEARSYGASIILESAPSKLSKTMRMADSCGASADLTQRIKRQLDPGAILSPA
jgi:FAD/FMN-containing dehydrogenase